MLIAELVDAHIDGVEAARRLMEAQAMLDDLEHAARAAIDRAAERPDDCEAADEAVATATAVSEASHAELEASLAWARHLKRVELLVRAAAVGQGVDGGAGGFDLQDI